MSIKTLEELSQILELTKLPWGIGRRKPALGEDKIKAIKLFYCYVGLESNRFTHLGLTMDEAVTRCIKGYEDGGRNKQPLKPKAKN